MVKSGSSLVRLSWTCSGLFCPYKPFKTLSQAIWSGGLCGMESEELSSLYSISSIPVVSAATPARPFCRGNFGISAV